MRSSWHEGSAFLIRDHTRAPAWRHSVLTAGPLGKLLLVVSLSSQWQEKWWQDTEYNGVQTKDQYEMRVTIWSLSLKVSGSPWRNLLPVSVKTSRFSGTDSVNYTFSRLSKCFEIIRWQNFRVSVTLQGPTHGRTEQFPARPSHGPKFQIAFFPL